MSIILRLQAENIKRLKAVEITADGATVVIGGRNAQGKSSVLDAIMYALAGQQSVCSDPIRHGESKAVARVELDNGLIVERTFTKKGSYLKVTKAGDDDRPFTSPQAMLDKLTGALTFDPLAFVNMAARDQAETLRKLTGLDFTDIDQNRSVTYQDRHAANAQVKSLRARLEAMPAHVDIPADAAGDGSLGDQLAKAMDHNSAVQSQQQAVESTAGTISFADEKIKRLADELAGVKLGRDRLVKDHADAKAALDELGPVHDLTSLQKKIDAAESLGRTAEANNVRAAAEAELADTEGKAYTLDKKIRDIDAEKAKQIADADLPVDGLVFAGDEVFYNDVPFEQASSAEQLLVSLEITAAMSPDLRVVLCRDASLLDNEHLKLIAKFAKDRDFQVWLERVGTADECSVIIEDGAVAAAV